MYRCFILIYIYIYFVGIHLLCVMEVNIYFLAIYFKCNASSFLKVFPVCYISLCNIASRARFLPFSFPMKKVHSSFLAHSSIDVFFGLLIYSLLFSSLSRLNISALTQCTCVVLWVCIQLFYCMLRLISAHFIGCCVWLTKT